MVRYSETVRLSKMVAELKEDTNRTKYEALVDNAIKKGAVEGKNFAYVEKYSETYYNEVEESWESRLRPTPLKQWLRDIDKDAYDRVLKKYEDDGYSIEESTYGYLISWRME